MFFCGGAVKLADTCVLPFLLWYFVNLQVARCLHLCLSSSWRLLLVLILFTCAVRVGEVIQPPLYSLVGSFWGPLWSPGLRQNSALLLCKHVDPLSPLFCGFVGCIWVESDRAEASIEVVRKD